MYSSRKITKKTTGRMSFRRCLARNSNSYSPDHLVGVARRQLEFLLQQPIGLRNEAAIVVCIQVDVDVASELAPSSSRIMAGPREKEIFATWPDAESARPTGWRSAPRRARPGCHGSRARSEH